MLIEGQDSGLDRWGRGDNFYIIFRFHHSYYLLSMIFRGIIDPSLVLRLISQFVPRLISQVIPQLVPYH